MERGMNKNGFYFSLHGKIDNSIDVEDDTVYVRFLWFSVMFWDYQYPRLYNWFYDFGGYTFRGHIYHAIPNLEDGMHIREFCSCSCNPTVQYNGNIRVYVHNSFDGLSSVLSQAKDLISVDKA